MTRTLRWSLRAYERLLVLYPEDLRRDFGADMMEAFAEDLAAARGVTGILRVWCSVLRELLQIAVPAWFEIPGVLVPLLSAAIVAGSQSPLVVLDFHRHMSTNRSAGDTFLVEAVVAIAIASALSAVTSFVAVYRWKRAGLISLGIS